MRRFRSSQRSLPSAVACAVLIAAGSAWAVAPSTPALNEGRAFDARVEFNKAFTVEQPAAQVSALETVRGAVPDLAVGYDDRFGTVRTLGSHTSYLSGPSDADPMDAALAFVRTNLAALGLSAADVAEYEVTDRVFSRVSGATHLYLRQMHAGIPVYNGQLHVNVNRDGRVLSVNNLFVRDLAGAARGLAPSLSAADALGIAAASLGMESSRAPQVLAAAEGVQQVTQLVAPEVAVEPVTARLMYLPIRSGQVGLVWNLEVQTPDGDHHYNFTVDARSGEVWTRHDYTAAENYVGMPQPLDGPTLLVTHQVNIGALVGAYPEEGDIVVVQRADGGELRVLGTIAADR